MPKDRITITLEKELLKKLDTLVDGRDIRSRSHAIERALFSHLEEGKVKQALILAGGEGTRLRPFTYEIPKPLIPIKGKPMLEHIINHLLAYGVKNFILSVGYMSEKIISHFGDGKKLGVHIDYVIEKERLGTAGPLRLAKDLLEEDFLMLNGDIL
ncbi:TPA: NTP transferase domain-containing protein [archaeon]|nr:NTP transferase domain-containing protein [Candidatus Naiadarchaeales archaeon SRR2090153.bin1042]